VANETVLIVDDRRSARSLLEIQMRNWGFNPVLAESGAQGAGVLEGTRVDLIISDLVMPDMDGIQFLARAREICPEVPFVLLTAYGSVDAAVEALKQGASDFLQKPYKTEELQAVVKRALMGRNDPADEPEIGREFTFQDIVSTAPEMRRVLQMAEQVTAYPQTTVALYGESGVGKEVLARAIHVGSGRPRDGFVAINCAGIPAALLESELFGHVKGAYTGAERDREGIFDLASGGTILLDEIGDMPLELQAKILRVIQERVYSPLGSSRQVKVDFRIIVATNRDLRQLVRRGRFRNDLYHRINTFPITIPPLRERKEEIPLLVRHFLRQLRKDLGKTLPGVSKRGMDLLMGYDWPGNIRELRNSLERACIMVDNEPINPTHLCFLGGGRAGNRHRSKLSGGNGEKERLEYHISLDAEEFSLDAVINQVLEMTLARCNNNKSLAAQILKTDRRIFYRAK